MIHSDPALAEKARLKAKKLGAERPAYGPAKAVEEIAGLHGRMVRVTPLEVLHEVGRATVFQERAAIRDYQRLWAQLRYCDVFGYSNAVFGVGNHLLRLTDDALAKRFHHKTTQSEYLGIGFAIVLARHVLERQHPDYSWLPVDAEMVLDAGFDVPGQRMRPRSRRGTNMRPDYFLLGYKRDGIRSRTRLVVLECKGTHGDDYAVEQLGKAAYQLNSVLVGGSTPPGLMIARNIFSLSSPASLRRRRRRLPDSGGAERMVDAGSGADRGGSGSAVRGRESPCTAVRERAAAAAFLRRRRSRSWNAGASEYRRRQVCRYSACCPVAR